MRQTRTCWEADVRRRLVDLLQAWRQRGRVRVGELGSKGGIVSVDVPARLWGPPDTKSHAQPSVTPCGRARPLTFNQGVLRGRQVGRGHDAARGTLVARVVDRRRRVACGRGVSQAAVPCVGTRFGSALASGARRAATWQTLSCTRHATSQQPRRPTHPAGPGVVCGDAVQADVLPHLQQPLGREGSRGGQ